MIDDIWPLSVLVASLEVWEGSVRWMYLDKKGLVTVGVGFLLKTPADANRYPFRYIDNHTPAPTAAIKREFDRVTFLLPDRPAAYYAEKALLELSDGAIDQALKEKLLTIYIPGIITRCPHFKHFPRPVQRALVDMAFNLGVGGFHKFGNLIDACNAHDWMGAADQCHRAPPTRESRNQWTKELFLQAARQNLVA